MPRKKRLVIRKPAPEPEKKLEDMSLDELQALAAKTGIGKVKPKPLPPKPPRKKVPKREVMGPSVDVKIWVPVIQKAFGDVFEYDEESLEVGRLDIYPKGEKDWPWRMTVMGFLGKEFSVRCYLDMGQKINVKCISVEYIQMHKLVDAIKFVLQGEKEFRGFENDKS